jgi:hypothetical protein
MTRHRDFRSTCAVLILFTLAALLPLPHSTAAEPAPPDVGTLQAENQNLKYQVERQDAKIAEQRRRISESETDLAIARGSRFSEPSATRRRSGRSCAATRRAAGAICGPRSTRRSTSGRA